MRQAEDQVRSQKSEVRSGPSPQPSPGVLGEGERGVLEREIGTIEGVGATKVSEFEARGVRTLGDLLEYFPRSYQQERSERPISQLVADQIQIARGEVVAVDYIPMRPRPRFEATLRDGSG